MKSTNRILTAMAVAAALLLVAGCETPNINPLSGGAVKFKAVSTQEKLAKTKTVYGTAYVEEGYQRIDWVVNDHIRIYSDKAKFAYDDVLHADYAVERVFSEEGNNRSSFATIKPEGVLDGEGTVANWQSPNGLEWGSGDHKFFGLYPSPAYFTSKYTSADPTQVFALTGGETDADAREFTLTQPSVLSWLETDLDANRAIKPNMDYAYMGAMTRATEGNTVELQFKPMFTAFQFTFDRGDEANLKFHKFTLKTSDGSPLTGQYKVVMTVPNSGDPAWTPTALSATSSSIVANFGPIVADEGPAGIVLDNSDKPNVTFTVFALPLDYGEAATKGLVVEIDVTPQSTATKVTRALELKDSMGNWVTFAGGHKYNINFDVNSQWEYFIDDLEGFTLTYEGGTNNSLYSTTALPAGFKSYRRNRNDATLVQPVEYKLQYSMDDGATWTDGLPTRWSPAWLTSVKSDGTAVSATAVPGSTTGAALTVDMAAQADSSQIAPYRNTHTDILNGKNTGGTSASPKDLSLWNVAAGKACDRTTANCYVVDGWGWFKFPVVYGNAVTNGAENQAAYTGTGTGDYVLETFRNSNDAAITSPYIPTDLGITSGLTAELVWTDHKSGNALLVDPASVAVESTTDPLTGGYYIKFNVPQNSIHEGNAVIALKDGSGNILWSWHIWVSDEDNKATATAVGDSHFAPFNVGWVNGEYVYLYNERTCRIRAVQKISGKMSNTVDGVSKGVVVTQERHSRAIMDNNPYFQWGRKDPLNPTTGYDTGETLVVDGTTFKLYEKKPQYAPDGTELGWQFSSNTANLGYAVKNPITIFRSSTSSSDLPVWYYKYYCNLWNAAASAASAPEVKVVKTVYDPSPSGYSVPHGGVFTALADLLRVGTMTLKDNFYVSSDERHYNGLTYGDLNISMVYNFFGYTRIFGTNSCLWSATPLGDRQSHLLTFFFNKAQYERMTNGSMSDPVGWFLANQFGLEHRYTAAGLSIRPIVEDGFVANGEGINWDD